MKIRKNPEEPETGKISGKKIILKSMSIDSVKKSEDLMKIQEKSGNRKKIGKEYNYICNLKIWEES